MSPLQTDSGNPEKQPEPSGDSSTEGMQAVVSGLVNAADSSALEKSADGADSKEPSLPEMKSALLYDVAVKRLDYQDRTFDALNTRAGAVFGFSTFVLSGCGLILGYLGIYPRLRLLVGMCFILTYGVMAYSCWRAFRVEGLKILPDPFPHYRDRLDDASDAAVRYELFGGYVKAYQENEGLVEIKAQSLARAIHALTVLVSLMIAGAASPDVYLFMQWIFAKP
ncbi:hypothetical protein [Corallococcus sp. AB011P]|uniref:hypothetical protein n=1 Tax=Corallococcus sp. AB011P TaxID=2316735 RepID=UPI0011C37496|nr:hypothetical protein [Corallococcus sp. AB011P]